jgi:hypothetical protein
VLLRLNDKLVLLLLALLWSAAFGAETPAKKRIAVMQESARYPGIYVVPDDVFSHYDGLQIIPPPAGEKPPLQPILLSWTSGFIDGHFTLTVTPEQVYLMSGHDNPNPNHLYWLKPFSKAGFDALQAWLARQQDKRFEGIQGTSEYWLKVPFHEKRPTGSDSKTIQRLERDHQDKQLKNLRWLVSLLNQGLTRKQAIPQPGPDALEPKVQAAIVREELDPPSRPVK